MIVTWTLLVGFIRGEYWLEVVSGSGSRSVGVSRVIFGDGIVNEMGDEEE